MLLTIIAVSCNNNNKSSKSSSGDNGETATEQMSVTENQFNENSLSDPSGNDSRSGLADSSKTASGNNDKTAAELISSSESQHDEKFFEGPLKYESRFGLQDSTKTIEAFPKIPRAIIRSSKGRHVVLRCPNDGKLLQWASSRMKLFTDWVICYNIDGFGESHNGKDSVKLYENPSSVKDIADYYFKKMNKYPQDFGGISRGQQYGFLLADIYRFGNLYTMEEYTWYDWMSSGNNMAVSWHTVDSESGESLGLEDIINEKDFDKFADIMIKHLRYWKGLWSDGMGELNPGQARSILDQRNGCALTPEGIVVYYHPYVIGLGFEGQFNSLVPYSEIQDMLKIEINKNK